MSKTTIPAGGITDGTLTSAKLDQDGAFVFNEDSADVDFRVESNGNANTFIVDGGQDAVGIGAAPTQAKLHIITNDSGALNDGNSDDFMIENTSATGMCIGSSTDGEGHIYFSDSDDADVGAISYFHGSNYMAFRANGGEKVRISSTGSIGVGQTGDDGSALTGGGDLGSIINGANSAKQTAFAFQNDGIVVNRSEGNNNNYSMIDFYRNGSNSGGISSSNTTVTYGTFCGVHYAQLTDDSKPDILVGTVLESINETCEWHQAKFTIPATKDTPERIRKEYVEKTNNVGDVITYNFEGTDYSATIIKESDEEYLARVKVSDTENSKAVYGVFESWMESEANDMQVASLGAFMIRVHKDETVAIGDYLQSKGDGTAKVQADDILRSSTIAKVVKTNKIKTYDDGSYLVSCTLHCG